MVTDVSTPIPAAFVAKHQQIIQGAREVFRECGYEGASVNDIAKRAGVSKGTLYNHFPDKESLFAACVTVGTSEVQDLLNAALVASQGSIEAGLMAVGQRFLEIMSSPDCITFVRIVEAEVGRQPKLGKLLYTTGHCVAIERAADFLDRACKRGQLEVESPVRAAQQFFALCRAEVDSGLRMGVIDHLTPEQIRTHVQHAVRVFLRAYAPRTGSNS